MRTAAAGALTSLTRGVSFVGDTKRVTQAPKLVRTGIVFGRAARREKEYALWAFRIPSLVVLILLSGLKFGSYINMDPFSA